MTFDPIASPTTAVSSTREWPFVFPEEAAAAGLLGEIALAPLHGRSNASSLSFAQGEEPCLQGRSHSVPWRYSSPWPFLKW